MANVSAGRIILKSHFLRLIVGLLISVLVASCGGGGGGSSASSSGAPSVELLDIPVEGVMSGYVAKGPVRGALVEVYSRDPGSPRTLIASTRTDENGYYKFLDLPPQARLVEVVATGGDYADEATNVRTPLEQPLRAFVVRYGDYVPATLTAFTEVAARRLERALQTQTMSNFLILSIEQQVAQELIGLQNLNNILPVNIMAAQDWRRYYSSDLTASILLAAVSKYMANAVGSGRVANRANALEELIDSLDRQPNSRTWQVGWLEAVYDIAGQSQLPSAAIGDIQANIGAAPASERIESGGPIQPLPIDGDYKLVFGIRPWREWYEPSTEYLPTHTVKFDSRGAIAEFTGLPIATPGSALRTTLWTARVRDLYGNQDLSVGTIGGGSVVVDSVEFPTSTVRPFNVGGSTGLVPYAAFKLAGAVPNTCHARTYRLKHATVPLIAEPTALFNVSTQKPWFANDPRSELRIAFFQNGYTYNAQVYLNDPSGLTYRASPFSSLVSSPMVGATNGISVPNFDTATPSTATTFPITIGFSEGATLPMPLTGTSYLIGSDARQLLIVTKDPQQRAQMVIFESSPTEDSTAICSNSSVTTPTGVAPPSGNYLLYQQITSDQWFNISADFFSNGHLLQWSSPDFGSGSQTVLNSPTTPVYSDSEIAMGWLYVPSNVYVPYELGGYFAVKNAVPITNQITKRYRMRSAVPDPGQFVPYQYDLTLSDLEIEIRADPGSSDFGDFVLRPTYISEGTRIVGTTISSRYGIGNVSRSGIPGYTTNFGHFALFGSNGTRLAIKLELPRDALRRGYVVVLDEVVGP